MNERDLMTPMTIGQMLKKAKSELHLMEADLSQETMFVFFVTAWHISDYLPPNTNGKSKNDLIKDLLDDRDFKVCNYLANRLKHRKVDRSRRIPVEDIKLKPGAELGRFILGRSLLGTVTRNVWAIDGDEVRPIELGQRLIEKWEKFLAQNNIGLDS